MVRFDKSYNTSYITVLFVTFFLGIFAGINFSDSSLDDLDSVLQSSYLDMRSFTNFFTFSDEFNLDICDSDAIDFLSKELYETGSQLTNLESIQEIDSAEYVLLKKRHNVNQVLFYTYYKNYFDSCIGSESIVLFLFNSTADNNLAELQGEVLGELVNEFNLRVLPMDYGYTKALDYFYNYYNTEEFPTLIVNYDNSLVGFQNESTLRDVLIAK